METADIFALMKYLRARARSLDRAIRSGEEFQRQLDLHRRERKSSLEMVPESSGTGKEIATPGHDTSYTTEISQEPEN